MGLMDAIFGGSKTVDLNTDEIRNMGRELFNYDPGLGKAGQLAKGYLKAVQKGRISDLPGVQLAIAQGQRNWTDLQRNLQMNTAMLPGEQSALTAGIMQSGMLKNQDQTGLNAINAAANDISNFSNIFNLARQTRINAELTGKQAGAEILQRGRQRVQTKGILGGIAELASAFTPLGQGLGLLKSGGGGGDKLGPAY